MPWCRKHPLSPRSPQKTHNRPAPGPGGAPALLAAARDRAARHGPAPCCAGMPARPPAATVGWWLELECGVTVYPAREEGGRWRAVWMENGVRRQCEAATEDRLAARLEKVTERLMADAPNLERPGADLIAWYLSPDRHPAGRPWSAKHADTQRRLCERFVAPVIAAITCQDIKIADMQRAVSAAPTAGEGARLHRCLSAMVTAGITGGYLTNPRLREVHWQPAAGPRPPRRSACKGNPRSSSTPPRSPPPLTSPGSARPWPPDGAGTCTS